VRILIVSPTLPYLPCHDAARLLPANLLVHLGDRHTLALVAATAPGDTPPQRRWAASLVEHAEIVTARRWREPITGAPGPGLAALEAAVVRAIERFGPDVVHLEGGLLAPLAGMREVPTVLAAHGSGALDAREARRVTRRPWRRIRARLRERRETAWERRWFTAAAACVVGSDDDRQELTRHLPAEAVRVIPAGIDARQYAFRTTGEPGRLVFTGALDRPRDAEAARRLATRILPLVRRLHPRAELLIVGGSPPSAIRALGALPGVRVTGLAPDRRMSVWSAAVYMSPLAAGFGAKERLLEAMALGTPIVASHRSLSGLAEVLPGHHVLTAETNDEFAVAALELMREPIVAQTIARNARALVERRYTWPAIVRRYDALYTQVPEAARPAVRAA
jgi:glycosyltransferase involved in cell wall biosynthesis